MRSTQDSGSHADIRRMEPRDGSLVPAPDRLILKRSVLHALDEGGAFTSLIVLLLGPDPDRSISDYVAEFRLGDEYAVRVDVTALLRALTPDQVIPS